MIEVHPTRRSALVARVLLLVLPLFAGCFSPRLARDEDVRPLKLRVVDAGSRRPLAGVPVLYAVEAMKERGRILGIWPLIEPDIGPRLAFKARGRTDERGEIVFHARKVHLPGNQRIEEDVLIVNLDVNLEHRTARIRLEVCQDTCRDSPDECAGPADDIDVIVWGFVGGSIGERAAMYRNPVATHRGVIVLSDAWPYQGAKDWTEPEDRFRLRWNPESLKKKAGDAVEVALEAYEPEQEVEARIAAARKEIESGRRDPVAGYVGIARDARSLAFLASTAEARATYREAERDAYRRLARADAANPQWFTRLADTFDDPADRIPPLRDGVARFPREYALRRALGSAMCHTEAKREGLEHLKEAARLVPVDPRYPEATGLETDAWFCDDAAHEVQRILSERTSGAGGAAR